MTEKNQITDHLRTLFEPGDVFEVRVLDAVSPGSTWTHTESGYFEYAEIDVIPNCLNNFASYGGVYVTMNPVNPDLLARANNRLKSAKRDESTKDGDVIKRRWMLIDIDPERPAGISANDAEKAAALDKAIEIQDGLSSMGFPKPIVVDSGNGMQLLYRINLPADDDDLVQRCLKALEPCSNKKVHVDLSVYNAARICRLPGTWNRKGDEVSDRVHRVAEVLETPEKIEVVSGELLQKLGGPIVASPEHNTSSSSSTNSVADDFNARGDIAPILIQHGWTLKSEGDQQYWYRPGKTSGKHSATYNGTTFYVFSSNAAPFDIKGYSRFGVYAHLEHNGNYASATEALKAQGYGPKDDVDLSGLLVKFDAPAANSANVTPVSADPVPEPAINDPGPIPLEMLRIPGFISEVMDHCLETSPYPSPVMAFCGALALQAYLGGRKVRDSGDNRSNLYLLGLAHSSAGKDRSRKLNREILRIVGLEESLGEKLASGPSIEDALFATPSMLVQTDEIDSMIQSINKSNDSLHEGILSTLLTMYSTANSIYPMRRKAGNAKPGVIDQPNLVIFGTAIPNHYYAALSERMLTNGFFARTLILEAGPRSPGQEPDILPLPSRILDTAKWWASYQPGSGNLTNWHPEPTIVNYTDDAKRQIIEVRKQSEVEYAKAEEDCDAVGTTVWGRVSEQTRKLALIYAISENHRAPRITLPAVQWASSFVMHQVRRMLFMAGTHVADNPFHAECLKVLEKLREAPGRCLSRSVLLKRMKMRSKDFSDLMETLIQREDVAARPLQNGGRAGFEYHLIEGVK